ncbi:nuclear transport factor 2 family protein [Algoriphagus sp.]
MKPLVNHLVETELLWPRIYSYDLLTLMKVDGKWKIVHKTWYEEIR